MRVNRISYADVSAFTWPSLMTMGRHTQKKMFPFGHHLNQTPSRIPPIRVTWSYFFGRQKRRFAHMTGIFFDDDNDACNDSYDDKGTPHEKKNVFFRATCTSFSAVIKEYIKCIF